MGIQILRLENCQYPQKWTQGKEENPLYLELKQINVLN